MNAEAVNGGAMEEDHGLGWRKSLPVPSVQEIVRNDSLSVPTRYIQEHKDRPLDSDSSPFSSQIPIIDLHLLAQGDEDERTKLNLACEEWGFFQVINHGVAEEVLKTTKAAVLAFFELPLGEKEKHSMAENDIQGYGQGYVVSDQQKLDWCDLIFLMTQPNKYKKMQYWPLKVAGFKEAIEEYATEMHKVTEEILGNLSLLMGMEKDGLRLLHEEMKQAVRLNYYPTCSRPDLVLGVSPHSDASSLTVLMQDDEITGLQIKHKGGWIPVNPIPNALVVNIGDAIEAWSNGMYKSIEHRAITNEKKARISIATFVVPDDGAKIGPVDSVVRTYHHQPVMYKKIKYVDYLRYTLSRRMDGKAHTDFLKLENE